uniref:Acyl-CoA synthetase short-chain family member 3, mitochondrial n=1 Tax=Molossus molossus TaxID=27622 RepID=A0A7J8FWJ0_MOLMO|nr:acyl-CoA synthetase short chain family member 3 [Molossus molossus]
METQLFRCGQTFGVGVKLSRYRRATAPPALGREALPGNFALPPQGELRGCSWFVEGMLNICYNAIDRHIENGKGDKIAIIYDSPVTNTKATITYKEVLEQVSKLAGVLVKHGVKKGDTVVIYMPMIPQAIYTMLACARIGAIHSLIFGGFASKELSTRIDHAKVSTLFGEIKQ